MTTNEQVYAIGINSTAEKLHLIEIPRRIVGPTDVRIQIQYCGICHTDIHHVRQEFGQTKLPAVPGIFREFYLNRNCLTGMPGHEIVGVVTNVGSEVTKYKVGETVGVGCLVDSCRTCNECARNTEQYCASGNGAIGTYGYPLEKDPLGFTQGGYSQAIVVDEHFVLSIPAGLELAAAAPLLCAGITVWSPIQYYGVKAGDSVAVKFAVALGATVTVLSRSAAKTDDAHRLGASAILITSDQEAFKAAHGSFTFIIDTVSAQHDLNALCSLLKPDGTLILVGVSPQPLAISPFALIAKRVKIGGSGAGGIKETQEMLDFCGKHNITCDIELVSVNQTEQAYERVLNSDVKFRFVLDVAGTLNKDAVVE
ncbi:hypothetical protein HK100_008796 [Physocladia obscura]|uniref:Enoyl reductase (ER) domain-containing protein n=1 Tax=Physocladia obscura TaxID=109957 RepID=A0AAD5SQ41_9FUNG|nr:hypothetical protein HK100_008796 [Physocladia obscura]